VALNIDIVRSRADVEISLAVVRAERDVAIEGVRAEHKVAVADLRQANDRITKTILGLGALLTAIATLFGILARSSPLLPIP
jgi:hypothetical protein